MQNIERWESKLDEYHDEAMKNLITEIRERTNEIRSQFEEQRAFLDVVHFDTKKGLDVKKAEVEKHMKTINELLEFSDCAPLEMQVELIKECEQVGESSLNDFVTSSSQYVQNPDAPVQYPMLKKKDRSKDIQYFTEFEVINQRNPCQNVIVDIETGKIAFELQFDETDFKGIGFDNQIPDVSFLLNVTCSHVDCQDKRQWIKLCYEEKDWMEFNPSFLENQKVTVKVEMKADCGHHFSWERGPETAIFFSVDNLKFKTNIPYNICMIE
jgi:hypothetical protein